LADLGLIGEYEFVVQPIVAGHGPTLFAGLSEQLELELVGRLRGRLPLGTRAWQLRHNAEVDRLVPSKAGPAAHRRGGHDVLR